ncbi:MAG TPA: hypothetical protein VLF94_05515 [Chlamydiales bacterium]|nr:hypothetical protein [Chlamydiales bacterium]
MATPPRSLSPTEAAQLAALSSSASRKAPAHIEPLHNLDLPDLNIRIHNLATSRVSVVGFRNPPDTGDWWLKVSNGINEVSSSIQEFVHQRELAVFHIVDRRKPTRAQYRELAQAAHQLSIQAGLIDASRRRLLSFGAPPEVPSTGPAVPEAVTVESIFELLKRAPNPVELIDPSQEPPPYPEEEPESPPPAPPTTPWPRPQTPRRSSTPGPS